MLQPLLPVQQRQPGVAAVKYRSLQPGDFMAVKAAHAALFPIDYDDSFFHRATNALDRIWSCAAFVEGPSGEDKLVGFITAKTVFLHECEVTDRQHMGLLSPIMDHDLILYILTLGVLEGYRHNGIASALIQAVCQRAYETRCRAVFLHVITYNTAAMNLYSSQGFACVARLSRFYYIATGRQPDPSTQVYDAYLYVQYVGGAGGLATPWDMLTLAWSPVRHALGRIHSCMPGFCRQQQQHAQQCPASLALPASSAGAVVIMADASRSSSHPMTSTYQQQQQPMDIEQPQQPQPPFGGPSFSRYRFRRAAASTSAAADRSSDVFKQQPQVNLLPHIAQQALQYPLHQQQQQQQACVLHTMPQHQLHSPRHQQHQNQQQQQQRPQRMLRWLFNGHSRPGLMRQEGQQQQQQQVLAGQHSLTGQQQQQQQQLQTVAAL